MACARPGSPVFYHESPFVRDHGFCCGTCKAGRGRFYDHLPGCIGFGQPTIRDEGEIAHKPRCCRPGCDFVNISVSRDDGFCCIACRIGHRLHSGRCSGAGRLTHLTPLLIMGFWLPFTWARGNDTALYYAYWLMCRYECPPDLDCEHAWHVLSARLQQFPPRTSRYPRRLFALREGGFPNYFQHTTPTHIVEV